MQNAVLAPALLVAPLLACGGQTPDVAARAPDRATTPDGLVQIDTDRSGDLFLRESHGIGGYDAIVIAPSFVNYRRGSERLAEDDEAAYLAALEQTLIDVADEANVEVVDDVGSCVINVGAGFVNVNLARSRGSKLLGEMTLVVEYRDSTSRQSLLRYVSREEIERESGGTSRMDQVRSSFDRMIANIDIISTLRKATSIPSPPQPGCQGALIRAGLPSGAALAPGEGLPTD